MTGCERDVVHRSETPGATWGTPLHPRLPRGFTSACLHRDPGNPRCEFYGTAVTSNLS
jgi:hypothetical protein